jgi:hypothetical protein
LDQHSFSALTSPFTSRWKARSGAAFSGMVRRLVGGILLFHSVVVGMCSDPVPQDSLMRLDANGAEMNSHANRPMASDFLETQRRMARIGFEESEVLVG